ncbi:MarR family transcriptional regulator [Sphingobium cloacae]|uniref:MarR family transcriptional regulator n=1 Tax=Sphingobium cloacae TaxID=120107 RepID=A0A1E1F5F2_9SPHN|nr:MarR family transcriptional regulator [Sphingobium cloacae]BAV65727.1 MarR family transcriptional regulator [Sphingobium cloacae]
MPSLERQHALSRTFAPVARGWRQLADRTLAEIGLSNSAGWCLLHLQRLGPKARQIDLAEALEISQPSLVRTLHQLEAARLVERLPHPGDRRSNRLALTPAGRELVSAIQDRLDDLRNDLLEGMSDADIDASVRLMEALGRRIAERRAEP